MSPQSITAFVLLSAFALSLPVQARVVKVDSVSHTDLTAALCAGLHYSPYGTNPLYDACVAANLVVNTNTLTTRANVQAGVTAALCAGLDVNVVGVRLLHDACVAAGLSVAADVSTKHDAPILNTSVDLYANAFLSASKGCQSLSSQLHTVLVGSVRLTTLKVHSLYVDLVIPTVVKITAHLNAAVATTANVGSCTDAAVEATVLQSYTVFATSLGNLLASLKASLTLCTSVEIKAIHSALASLRATLVVYTQQLDNFISADLARSNVKVALFLSLDALVKLTV